MHSEAYDWVRRSATTRPVTVLDLGGRDINGTVRPLFPCAVRYTVLDIRPGEGVDIVADAATWTPDGEYDVVVCCEVFEHTDVWPEICATAYAALKPEGQFIVTCAGPGRSPHSAVDGEGLKPGEYYGNVSGPELEDVLVGCGFKGIVIDEQKSPADTRAVAVKPGKTKAVNRGSARQVER